MSKQHILVTGGAGYIGSTLVPYLIKNNYKVTVLDNLLFNQCTLLDCCHYDDFNFIQGDICDYSTINKLINKADIVIPLAAIVGAPACNIQPELSKLINRSHICIATCSKYNYFYFIYGFFSHCRSICFVFEKCFFKIRES